MIYSAKEAYQTEEAARGYEQRSMYKGYIGRRRTEIEKTVIKNLIDDVEFGSVMLDCPCGNGRWFSLLATRAGRIIAKDISKGMVRVASERASLLTIPITVQLGDAEGLDLGRDAVDYTFCYALMKHLPKAIQARVLKEFARVSTKAVICSFAVFKQVSRLWWAQRHMIESYPVTLDELDSMAKGAGLEPKKLIKISQPIIGLEHFVVFSRKPALF